MTILRFAAPSPYVRKVRIAAALLGLADQIELQPTDTSKPDDAFWRDNPLGKIPVLKAEDGAEYYDSRVIVEYLDQRAGGGKIIPRDGAARFSALRMQALGDGINDASLLQVYEGRYRPAEKIVQGWLDLQAGKVARGLAALEAAPPPPLTATPDVGQIAVACALGYLDLRFAGAWRKTIRVRSAGSINSPARSRRSAKPG
ncbi:MAG: glutathione S-transferase N-terminal domain-containing protein [Pseudolabrys sp.]